MASVSNGPTGAHGETVQLAVEMASGSGPENVKAETAALVLLLKSRSAQRENVHVGVAGVFGPRVVKAVR